MDAVKRKIDESLATDNQLRRQRGMMELRSPYRFPDLTEMVISMPPGWIQWISREVNELCNKLTLIIDQEMNKKLSEFRLIPQDIELEGESQPDLMGFKTPQQATKLEFGGKRATAFNRDCMNTKINCGRKIQIPHR